MTWFEKIETSRAPDFVIGLPDDPYMQRWWIIPRNRIFNVYLHRFLHSDDDRALHDHPWFNLSILLKGKYVENTIAAGGVKHSVEYKQGAWKFRSPWAAHQIEIEPGTECWSLFITGPVMRNWGFHCPAGWRPWQIFVKDGQKGQIGKGCE